MPTNMPMTEEKTQAIILASYCIMEKGRPSLLSPGLDDMLLIPAALENAVMQCSYLTFVKTFCLFFTFDTICNMQTTLSFKDD